jgi:hypothetical protein
MTLLSVRPYSPPAEITPAGLEGCIAEISGFPAQLIATMARLTPAQLAEKTLPGNWTASQVIHHVADSHMNAFIRCKLALTEETPTVKPYEESEWAKFPDADSRTDVQVSVQLLAALHARWTAVLKSIHGAAWKRAYFHPGEKRTFALEEVVHLYAWHGRNHLAHVHELMQARGWLT